MDDDADAALEKFFEEARGARRQRRVRAGPLRGRFAGGPAGCSRRGSPSGGLQGAESLLEKRLPSLARGRPVHLARRVELRGWELSR